MAICGVCIRRHFRGGAEFLNNVAFVYRDLRRSGVCQRSWLQLLIMFCWDFQLCWSLRNAYWHLLVGCTLLVQTSKESQLCWWTWWRWFWLLPVSRPRTPLFCNWNIDNTNMVGWRVRWSTSELMELAGRFVQQALNRAVNMHEQDCWMNSLEQNSAIESPFKRTTRLGLRCSRLLIQQSYSSMVTALFKACWFNRLEQHG